ncbi:cation:proton antiporter [Sphingomonas solaris]|nr:cation:proton antiporter [Sphingomonas solaris]
MFEVSSYPLVLAVLGCGLIVAYWLPRFVSGREPAASTLLIAAGAVARSLLPGLGEAIDPTVHAPWWEHVSEFALIIGLFGTGLRIDRLTTLDSWTPTIRLLALGMPLCIAIVAVLGSSLAGMTFVGALLLGAVLAPTDPVLAGAVQVGPPLEGGEHPVRYTLTTEAGLNDGLAFPFVHLALMIGAAGVVSGDLVLHWFALDVVYRIAVGALGGIAIGWLLGRILFGYPRGNPLAGTNSGVVAIAGTLVCYGVTELLEGYGFIAVFVAGMTLRRSEARHEFHRTLHDFTETIEHALTAALLIALGLVIPRLLPALTAAHVVIGVALVFVIRPLVGWLVLSRTALTGRGRALAAFYGVRGIGSIYYIAYAGGHVKLVNEAGLWTAVAFAIVLSTIVHGLTAGIAIERVTGEKLGTGIGPARDEDGPGPAPREPGQEGPA